MYSKVKPPVNGQMDQALIRDGWSRWESYAGQPKTQTARYEGVPQHGQTIKNARGTDAVATKLDPSEYGGLPEMDLGYCQSWILHGKCEFVSWELCPLRHWIAEPIEMR
jgi:hypothetical protein